MKSNGVPVLDSRLSALEGKFVRVWIEDNGIGISSEYHERIFRMFERLHGVGSYPGTGIGLAIVRKGVERMGGRAGVESVLGAGSRFWVELPAA
jgi:signal transduction histidine kinase